MFREFDAPMEFDSIDTLERYMNQLPVWFKKNSPLVKLERELVLVYSDLHKDSFMFDDNRGLYIIDFADAAFLPPSFLRYTLHCPLAVPSIDVASMVRGDFDLPMDNLPVMRRISMLTSIPVYKLGKWTYPVFLFLSQTPKKSELLIVRAKLKAFLRYATARRTRLFIKEKSSSNEFLSTFCRS